MQGGCNAWYGCVLLPSPIVMLALRSLVCALKASSLHTLHGGAHLPLPPLNATGSTAHSWGAPRPACRREGDFSRSMNEELSEPVYRSVSTYW